MASSCHSFHEVLCLPVRVLSERWLFRGRVRTTSPGSRGEGGVREPPMKQKFFSTALRRQTYIFIICVLSIREKKHLKTQPLKKPSKIFPGASHVFFFYPGGTRLPPPRDYPFSPTKHRAAGCACTKILFPLPTCVQAQRSIVCEYSVFELVGCGRSQTTSDRNFLSPPPQ